MTLHLGRSLRHTCGFASATCLSSLPFLAGATSWAPSGLNDTGTIQCAVAGAFSTECAGTGQDAAFGRDAFWAAPSNGLSGFAFKKICNSGQAAGTLDCPSNPSLGRGPNQWGCTQDTVTKLIWEVKTADNGLRDYRKTYSNFGDGRSADASQWVAQVNAVSLCGAKDWALPTVHQL